MKPDCFACRRGSSARLAQRLAQTVIAIPQKLKNPVLAWYGPALVALTDHLEQQVSGLERCGAVLGLSFARSGLKAGVLQARKRLNRNWVANVLENGNGVF
jgi:hypothetical protein